MLIKKLGMTFVIGAISLSIAGEAEAAPIGNVTAGKTVAGSGVFFQGGWGGGQVTDFGSLTDGMYFPDWHQWDQGPVWWDEGQPQSANNSLTVYLGKKDCKVVKLTIQVDNNDDYKISWNDAILGPQQVIAVPARNWGMAPAVSIHVNAKTKAFKIEHDSNGAGDGLYSVSEFKAYGVCPL
jgi:hypothetical protein